MAPSTSAFLDPPYGRGLGKAALASLAAGGWLKPGALAVLEETSEAEIATPEGFEPSTGARKASRNSSSSASDRRSLRRRSAPSPTRRRRLPHAPRSRRSPMGPERPKGPLLCGELPLSIVIAGLCRQPRGGEHEQAAPGPRHKPGRHGKDVRTPVRTAALTWDCPSGEARKGPAPSPQRRPATAWSGTTLRRTVDGVLPPAASSRRCWARRRTDSVSNSVPE